MSQESQRVFISNRLTQRMRAFDPTMKIAIPNLPFDQPEGQVFGKMYLLGGRSVNAGKSGEQVLVRYTGILQVSFFSPNEKGTKRACEAVDEIIRVFENYRGRDAAGVDYTFKTAETRQPEMKGNWHTEIVRIPYFRDEYKDLPAVTV